MKRHTARSVDLINGPIIPGILRFALPIFLGQLLQQLYNLADAWVVGNFADNNAFAAVSSATNLTLLIIGFFNGIALGGGVVISRYFGAGDQENVEKAIHTNFLLGLIASVLSTVVGLLLVPHILVWMKVPESVLPDSLCYFNFYFAGVSTIIMFNICMAIMQALGDSLRPLYYLAIASITNVIMDLVLVAGFHLGVGGAVFATVLAQGLSAAAASWSVRGKERPSLRCLWLRLYPRHIVPGAAPGPARRHPGLRGQHRQPGDSNQHQHLRCLRHVRPRGLQQDRGTGLFAHHEHVFIPAHLRQPEPGSRPL